MKAEHVDKTSSLKDIAETQPKRETVIELRSGFEHVLQKYGEEANTSSDQLEQLAYILSGSGRVLVFHSKVQIPDDEDSSRFSVYIFRRKRGGFSKNSIMVDIGMRLEGGEPVRLVLSENNRATWTSMAVRSVLGDGLHGLPEPTQKDLELHKQVLDIILNPQTNN